jgi:hypothetical protein
MVACLTQAACVCKAHEDADPCEVAHANTVSRRPNRENDGAREGPIGSGVVGFRWGCFNSCPAQFSYAASEMSGPDDPCSSIYALQGIFKRGEIPNPQAYPS